MEFKFNLNHSVKVKLTDKGYKYQVERLQKTFEHVPDDIKENILSLKEWDEEYYKSRADENGYSKFQLHDFIETFGPIIGMCKRTHEYFDDFNLIIDSRDLEEVQS